MARARIIRIGFGTRVKDESPLRRIWEQQGKCVEAVRLHLQREKWEREKANKC